MIIRLRDFRLYGFLLGIVGSCKFLSMIVISIFWHLGKKLGNSIRLLFINIWAILTLLIIRLWILASRHITSLFIMFIYKIQINFILKYGIFHNLYHLFSDRIKLYFNCNRSKLLYKFCHYKCIC